ncbi:MAG: sulfate ABC transporter permease subunit CysT [Mesorhizobium sp.]|jgi:sulfate/thiosulfate transport system permease protein|uniref:sulfate ABC transporter permease subunit CysT n=2 Tax=Mesorhizobium TaxID=68287 RepID=UPI000FC9B613|nr:MULTISPECIES: sulfate ABC transporter permease subunit CysT [unclassified Mesorhizobium]RUV74174.1 sulfate ABC transporter permease subunit CysT [Mesorhizobium sp. M5C.F.Cr.IN.023.01.1.1]RWB27098.1 MAG: sulfate ABC transporter permease subunit CysT [Mesorhizobium sp.]RWB65052.1 MAG: sulfate ABC transporter permease subunit CysT [Mesorhizobium sp.]RWC05575.1 MAG: sulfate ABC transporter permease subunit CysT [Mesorhizobium sp.]RWD08792.1 MAG: sulfate ABC transporter permease subunit CysT [Me
MTTAPAKAGWRFRQPSVIPGFGLTLGFSLAYLTLIILIPLSGLIWRSAALGWADFWAIATDRRTINALEISFGTAFIAAAVNVVFGTIVAWVLVRYNFPGRRIVDAMVDLPFALPTAVAGIALTTLYAPNGWLGSLLAPLGIKVAYTPLGIVIALIFIGLPFVVRTVQPIMEEIDKEVEEVAATLGANRFQTIARVLLPGLAPAIVTGFALAFARGVGEYGSVIFIAGNLPYKSEIAPLLIVIRLEEYNYAAATAIAAIMLALSFVMLLVINLVQTWSRKRYG